MPPISSLPPIQLPDTRGESGKEPKIQRNSQNVQPSAPTDAKDNAPAHAPQTRPVASTTARMQAKFVRRPQSPMNDAALRAELKAFLAHPEVAPVIAGAVKAEIEPLLKQPAFELLQLQDMLAKIGNIDHPNAARLRAHGEKIAQELHDWITITDHAAPAA